jgi:D-alanyl-lipoteichoic acid acyltransferase DltB (MBOAT superfamily)
LGFTIVIDYFAGIFLEKIEGKKRKIFLIASLAANIGVLAVFKYYNFLFTNLTTVIGNFSLTNPLPALSIILPIGLSFHTFQAMSYNIEVYRGNQKAEKNFGIYALYVMFYPQLVAGPIERPQNLLHQFYEKHNFDFERFKSGFTLMAFGLFKKVVIADRLAMAVDYSYSNASTQSGLSLAISSIFYAFQIYCDFSGYSDMAIGAARIMGFRLMDNFNAPYFAKSISEFWHRWHISLSTWFRDYLYFPLGGSRVAVPRWFINLFIVFLISGLWHGANWTFVIWGAIHGLLLILAILKNKILDKTGLKSNAILNWPLLNIAFTFILVCLAWIFFRSSSVNDAYIILTKIFSLSWRDSINIGIHRNEIIFCFILILSLIVKEKYYFVMQTVKTYQFVIINIIILLGCYFLGVFNQKQFIYFQF